MHPTPASMANPAEPSTSKPRVRFALPQTTKNEKREPFNVRRVYSAIFLVWLVLVMGIARVGRDNARSLGLVRRSMELDTRGEIGGGVSSDRLVTGHILRDKERRSPDGNGEEEEEEEQIGLLTNRKDLEV